MRKIEFGKEYRRLATQMTGFRIAGNWARLAEALETAGVALTAAEAARWANLGYLPEEAGPLILSGITAEQQGEMEAHAEGQVGGPEALAALRIAEIVAQPGWYGPDDAIVVEDPMRPGQAIITIREEACTATKVSPTATGDVEVRCAKPAGHVELGDQQHEGRVGPFPVRWRD